MKKHLILALIVAIICTSSCQRDDICPETTQTTPKLVIEFFDINNPEQLKSVPRLNVKAEGEENFFFETSENVSTITIPLRTTENFTNYTFVRNNDCPILRPNNNFYKPYNLPLPLGLDNHHPTMSSPIW